MSQPWYRDAACAEGDVDKDAWFSDEANLKKYAKSVCQGCPVRNQCLEYSLGEDALWGVWGGLDARQRRTLLRGRPVRMAA